ncbi:hypothetical protein [Methanobrevibacter sp.]|uniref:hypothetical protein n=1 Tax=Methanobrevibacter sp. TaxID=66852 RepID=UPI003863BFB2
MISKIKYSPYYYLNSRQLNLSDFGLKINNKDPEEKIFSIAKKENMLLNFVELTYKFVENVFNRNIQNVTRYL